MFKKMKERFSGKFFKQEATEVFHIDLFAGKHVSVSESEIKEWLKYSVTREFLLIINDLKKVEDRQVHLALVDSKLEEAAVCNAGLAQLREILSLPSIMIQNAQEEEDET